MSISDGQIVLRRAERADSVPALDAAASLSRMGTRAYYPALQSFGPQVRTPRLASVCFVLESQCSRCALGPRYALSWKSIGQALVCAL